MLAGRNEALAGAATGATGFSVVTGAAGANLPEPMRASRFTVVGAGFAPG